jgi:hypothetical protein
MAKSTNSGGMGFASLLTILFITLKLTGVINWSWVWVLCPLWIGFAVFVVGAAFGDVFRFAHGGVTTMKGRWGE